jgi:hypothetical protein
LGVNKSSGTLRFVILKASCLNSINWENVMAQGSKKKYTSKQKRQADHIEEGYEKKGASKKTAKARAWATVNKSSGGGKKSGSGRGKKTNKAPMRKGGKAGGRKKRR